MINSPALYYSDKIKVTIVHPFPGPNKPQYSQRTMRNLTTGSPPSDVVETQ